MLAFTRFLPLLAIVSTTLAVPSLVGLEGSLSDAPDSLNTTTFAHWKEKRTCLNPSACSIFPCATNQYCESLCCITCSPGTQPVPGYVGLDLQCHQASSSGFRRTSDCGFCQACPADTYSSDGSPCQSCPGGQQPNPSATGCMNTVTSCSAGYQLSNGACQQCPANQYSKAGGACTPCVNGGFSNSGAATCQCPSTATYDYNQQTCVCSRGQHLVNNVCSNCPAGQVSDGINCYDCGTNQYSQAGASQCSGCPSGSTSSPGSASCTCTLTGISTTSQACPTTCPAGQQNNGGACGLCAANTFSTSGGSCQSCPSGSVSQAGSAACTCTINQQPTTGSSCPTTCSQGFQKSSDGTCATCPSDTYSKEGITCRPCVNGGTSSPGSSTCNCPGGSTYDYNQQICVCSRGSILVNSVCTACGAGQTSDGINCFDCGTNQYSSAGGTCQGCPNGQISEPGSASCTCPNANQLTTGGTCTCKGANNVQQADGSCICEPGYFLGANGYDCFQCAAGSFSPGGPSCQVCPVGTFSGPGAGSCTACSAGTIAPNTGTTVQCIPCGSGRTSNQAHTTCILLASQGLQKKSKAHVCDEGRIACPAPGSPNAFECIDTSSDIQSCGGCWSTGDGVDCTEFDPMASASCVSGVCKYVCPRGYQLTSTGCERMISQGSWVAKALPVMRMNVNGTSAALADYQVKH